MAQPTEPSAQPEAAKLAKHSLVYSLAPLLQRFIALALTRAYTDALSPARWGVTQVTDLLFTALIQISGVNVLNGIVRFYFDAKEERERRCVVSTVLISVSALAWTLVGVALLFREPLTRFLFVVDDPELANDDLVACLVVSLMTIPLALSSDAAFRYLQVQQRSALITTLRVSKSLFETLLKVVFVVGLEQGVIGFLLAVLIGELVNNLLLTAWVLRQVGLRVSWQTLRPILAYAAPLVPVGLCQMGLNQIDRMLLKQLAPPDVAMGWVGIYGLGFMAGWMVQLVLVGSFMQIWQPWIFGVKDPAQRRELVAKVSTWALFAIGIASAGLILFGRELVRLLSGDPLYWEAFRVVPWVAAGYVFFALNGLAQVPLFIAKRTWPMLWLNVAALALNIGLNVTLIPARGFVGAALTTLCTFMFLGVCGQWMSQRLTGARFENGRLATMLAVVLAVTWATVWIDGSLTDADAGTFTFSSLAKLGLFVLVVGIVFAGLLRRDERAALIAKLRERLSARRAR